MWMIWLLLLLFVVILPLKPEGRSRSEFVEEGEWSRLFKEEFALFIAYLNGLCWLSL